MVSAGYFDTVGVRLVRGRFFSPAATADDQLELILNQAAVERHFPEEDPIGREIQLWGHADDLRRVLAAGVTSAM